MPTYDILRITDGTPTAYNLRKASETDLVTTPTVTPLKNGSKSVYPIANGDSRYPTTITVTVTDDANGFGGRGTRNATLSVSSWLKYDDGAGEISYSPVNGFIGFNISRDIPFENSDLMDLLEATLGFVIGGITAGEATSLARLNKLTFGTSNIF